MERPEWDAQTYNTVQPGSGAEEMTVSGVEGEAVHSQGLQSLWAPPGDGELLQIPGTSDLGGRRRLAGGGE